MVALRGAPRIGWKSAEGACPWKRQSGSVCAMSPVVAGGFRNCPETFVKTELSQTETWW
jgi:hypothetical protein